MLIVLKEAIVLIVSARLRPSTVKGGSEPRV
jgi:hypothetical protein